MKNFYLKNIIENHEYYKILIRLIQQDNIDKYYLMEKQVDGFVYLRL